MISWSVTLVTANNLPVVNRRLSANPIPRRDADESGFLLEVIYGNGGAGNVSDVYTGAEDGGQ